MCFRMKLFSHIVVNVHNTHSSIHNSEKKEFLESMVYPLETMRRELKDIMKRAIPTTTIITGQQSVR